MPDQPSAFPSRNALLQLVRPANVVTSLADVLAGYAVSGRAAGADLVWLLGSTACLYAGGIVLNDVFDRRIDAIERPERPLPSGKVSTATAATLGSALLALGVVLARGAGVAPALVAAAVALSVLLYDTWGKHQAFAGPLNMGLCRALNLLLGMSATPATLGVHWPLGSLPLVYITAVTMVSRGEVGGGRKRAAQAALGLVIAVVVTLTVLSIMAAGSRVQSLSGLALTVVLGWRILPAFRRAVEEPVAATLRAAVRTGVLSLVLLNAVIAAVYADIIYSLAILLTGVLAGRLARWFAVT